MKKAVSAIVLLLYFTLSSGVVINLHYCMDRFDSFQLGTTGSDYCSKCGMYTSESNGCCHNEVKIIKIQDDQVASAFHFQFESPAAVQLLPVFLQNDDISSSKGKNHVNNHSPPLSKQDTYLLNRVFRI